MTEEPTRDELIEQNQKLTEELERFKRQAAALLGAGASPDQERQLERYREYRHFFEKGAPLHIVIAADGTFEDANESFLKCFGYTKDEALGMPVMDLVVPEHRERALEVLEAEFSGRPSGLLNLHCKAKDGSLRKIRSSGDESAAAVYRDGQPVRIYATFIDVTHATDVMATGLPPAPGRIVAFTALDWIAVVVVGLFGLGLLLTPLTLSAVFMAMYRDFSSTLPGVTVMVTSVWYALFCGLLVLGPLVPAIFGRLSLAARRLAVLAGFVIGLAATVFYVLGVYAPIFELAGAVGG